MVSVHGQQMREFATRRAALIRTVVAGPTPAEWYTCTAHGVPHTHCTLLAVHVMSVLAALTPTATLRPVGSSSASGVELSLLLNENTAVRVSNVTALPLGPGELLTGALVVTTREPLSMRGIRVEVEGCASVRWTTGSGKHRHTHHAAIQLFNPIWLVLFGRPPHEAGADATLPAGQHTLQFAVRLPACALDGDPLPASYAHDGVGAVTYSMRAYCDIAWATDPEVRVALPFGAFVPPPPALQAPVAASSATVVPSFLCCGAAGVVTLALESLTPPVAIVAPLASSVALRCDLRADTPAAAASLAPFAALRVWQVRSYHAGSSVKTVRTRVWDADIHVGLLGTTQHKGTEGTGAGPLERSFALPPCTPSFSCPVMHLAYECELAAVTSTACGASPAVTIPLWVAAGIVASVVVPVGQPQPLFLPPPQQVGGSINEQPQPQQPFGQQQPTSSEVVVPQWQQPLLLSPSAPPLIDYQAAGDLYLRGELNNNSGGRSHWDSD